MPYTTGEVTEAFFISLLKLLMDPWEPAVAAGMHRCPFCRFTGVVVTGGAATNVPAASMSIMVRVADARAHFERAKAHGATIIHEPTDYPYGERQYSFRRLCLDLLANHRGRRPRRLGWRARRAVI
jgi:predicted enzyme related to lactoylglutathione lyase